MKKKIYNIFVGIQPLHLYVEEVPCLHVFSRSVSEWIKPLHLVSDEPIINQQWLIRDKGQQKRVI